jgi:hypothetical protein
MDRKCRRNAPASPKPAQNSIAERRMERPDVFPELPEMQHTGNKSSGSRDRSIKPFWVGGLVDLAGAKSLEKATSDKRFIKLQR